MTSKSFRRHASAVLIAVMLGGCATPPRDDAYAKLKRFLHAEIGAP